MHWYFFNFRHWY